MSTSLPLRVPVVSSEGVPAAAPRGDSAPTTGPCAVTRVACDGTWSAHDDCTAIEEPLQVRVDGQPFAVIMRTPGEDDNLVTGFLLAESVIRSWDDVEALEPARNAEGHFLHNVMEVRRTARARQERGSVARGVATSAACGLCGRQQIESLTLDLPPIPITWQMTSDTVHALPDALRRHQHRFAATGGLHAAALFTPDGTLLPASEDVGRHNAVDKVIGHQVRLGRLPLCDVGLFVSGRVAFEIVQKAALAGVGFIAAVSAPSSLAVELATATGITLAGFVRDRRFNVYSHPARIVPSLTGPGG